MAFVANAASLALAVALQPKTTWPDALIVSGAGIALSAVTAFFTLRRPSRSARKFVYTGAVATALCVLSYAGLIGGSVALAGAVWGVVQTYEPDS